MRQTFPSKKSHSNASPNSPQRSATRFTIKIETDWLNALESLIGLVRNQCVHTPEELLEKAIFSQLETQLTQKG